MKTIVFTLLVIFTSLCFGIGRADKKLQAETKRKELKQKIEALEHELAQKELQFQRLSEQRWSQREKQVKQKKQNKEKLEKLQHIIQRQYTDVARVREERLARENVLENEEEILQQKQLENDFLVQTIEKKREQESQMNLARFPLDQDTRMAALIQIDRTYTSKRSAFQKLSALIDLKLKTLRQSNTIGIGRRTFVLQDGEAVTAQVLRIGQSMAYAMTPDGSVYFLGSTGRIGTDSFTWNQITDSELTARIASHFPRWIETRNIQGDVAVDILQNSYSSTLISGEQLTWKTKVREFFRAGGPVMIPLALIVLWALLLILNRIVIFSLNHRVSHRFMKEAISLLTNNKSEEATTLADKRKGICARILSTCLHHKKWKRSVAEKSVKELLLGEVPKLDKHLNTLAVLAAAAPLLGLLGTVTGMIRMFEAITRFGTDDPKLLAGGISEALITTEVGLTIAIPILLIHNFLRNRRNTIQSHLEMYAIQILNRLWPEE